jgi:hypothetical protein
VLKDTDAVSTYHLGSGSETRTDANKPISIPGTLAALEDVLRAHAH